MAGEHISSVSTRLSLIERARQRDQQAWRELVDLYSPNFFAQHQITLSLTFDHRIIDGAPADSLLRYLVKAIGTPPEMP